MVQKRPLNSTEKPAGCAQFLFLACVLVAGLALLHTASATAYRSSLTCQREAKTVLCELRKVYPGSITTSDQLELRSVTVDSRSYVLRGSSRSYEILVLNADIDLPLGSQATTEPRALAARLEELLAGKSAALPTIPLREPSYGMALTFFLLGALMAVPSALILFVKLLRKPR